MSRLLTITGTATLEDNSSVNFSVNITTDRTIGDLRQQVAVSLDKDPLQFSFELLWNSNPLIDDSKVISSAIFLVEVPTLRVIVKEVNFSPTLIADAGALLQNALSDANDNKSFVSGNSLGFLSFPKVVLHFTFDVNPSEREKIEEDILKDLAVLLGLVADSDVLSIVPPAEDGPSSDITVALSKRSEWERMFNFSRDFNLGEPNTKSFREKFVISTTEYVPPQREEDLSVTVPGDEPDVDSWRKETLLMAKTSIRNLLTESDSEFVIKDILCTLSRPDSPFFSSSPSSPSSYYSSSSSPSSGKDNVKMLVWKVNGEISRSGFDYTLPQRKKLFGDFGTGYYATSFLDHAIFHQSRSGGTMSAEAEKIPEGTEIYLLGVLCNVGNVNEIDAPCRGLIPDGFDSNHMTYPTPGHDEWVINNPKRIRVTCAFSLIKIKKLVLWRDPQIANEYNALIFSTLQGKYRSRFNVHGVTTTDDALSIIDKRKSNTDIILITNGGNNGEGLVQQFRSRCPNNPVIVFCWDLRTHQAWARNYHNVIVTNQEDVFLETLKNAIDG